MRVSPRVIDAVLVIAVFVDLSLVVWTAADPGWWFESMHGHRQPSDGELAFEKSSVVVR